MIRASAGRVAILARAAAPGGCATVGMRGKLEITAKGSRLVVDLNGVKTAGIQHRTLASGPIALQGSPGHGRVRQHADKAAMTHLGHGGMRR
jgi:hypothetical protein